MPKSALMVLGCSIVACLSMGMNNEYALKIAGGMEK